MYSIMSLNLGQNYSSRSKEHKFYSVNNLNQQNNYEQSFRGTLTKNLTKNNSLKTTLESWFTIIKDFFVNKKSKNMTLKELKIKEFKEQFPNGIKKATPQEIFDTLGISCSEDKNGKLTISGYKSAVDFYGNNGGITSVTLGELGIDERKLIKNVKVIDGHADFNESQLSDEDLKNIEYIDRISVLLGSKMKNIGKLEEICGGWSY